MGAKKATCSSITSVFRLFQIGVEVVVEHRDRFGAACDTLHLFICGIHHFEIDKNIADGGVEVVYDIFNEGLQQRQGSPQGVKRIE